MNSKKSHTTVMSSAAVSQINFWRPTTKAQQEAAEAKKAIATGDGGDGAQYLSYNMFLGLAVLGGFFALDHLYLRSPLTFVAKIVVNILFLGVWWLYDASQAIFNRDAVKVFGLGVPGLGPKGIAAGVLASETPDKKHMRFFAFAFALIFGGIFGLDSFLTGDKQSGIIRIISLVTVIFAPVAIFWWLFNLGKFFFNTKGIIEANEEYFGKPAPTTGKGSIIDTVIDWFPILAPILGPVKIVKNTAEALVTADPDVILKGPIGKALTVASEAAGPVVIPVTTAVQSAAQAVSNVASAAKSSLNLATASVETARAIGDDVAQTVKPLVNMAGQAAELQAGLGPAAIQAAAQKLKQDGGAQQDSNLLGYTLLGTLLVVAVSGFVATIRRSKENVKPSSRDDTPPQPGVL